ncbi:MAG: sulfatase-like hydrolase/transferase [Acidobacteria bacterium]|nr:sulfatase-like hydrolase/transferase [Acidobacteriota bacterium]
MRTGRPRFLHQITGVLALGLAAGVVACAPAASSPPPVLLIVIDTVRADHMSLYGYERDTTPRLKEWAESGTVVENAFSAAAWTLPGVSSILTGLYPAQHGAGNGVPSPMHDDIPTLAERLKEQGYATGATANVSFLTDHFGLHRGFDLYDFHPAADDGGLRPADANVDIALEWIAAQEQPYFFMLHMFDAHRHYDAPEPARGTFTEQFADRYEPGSLATMASRIEAERRGDLEFHVAAYDEEILWLDMQLDRLFLTLQERGTFDDTLVILTSDHGEAFRDHEHSIGHGSCLHNEVIRVPLVIWEPGRLNRGRRVGPVATVDLKPTVLEAVGEPVEGLAGVSLLPFLRGEDLPSRAIFAQNNFYRRDLTALIRWPLKFIQDHGTQERLLYDLEVDPGETDNLWDPDDPDTARLVNSMRREIRAIRQAREGQAVEMSPELAERLRALGYIQ